jgi:DNA-binding NtrC family response regulator
MEPTENSSRVLVVDDEENQRTALATMLKTWGFAAEAAADGIEALEKLTQFTAHAVITDLMMPRLDGFGFLERLKSLPNPPPVIVLTAFGNIETAVATVHDLGAFWFLEKPFQPQALRLLVDRAVAQGRLREQTDSLTRQLSFQGVLGDLVGGSRAMQSVFSLLRQVAPSRAAVLLIGESGTGKELAARAIHVLSNRRAGGFVAVNCAALPETLIESELFGHEKGSFTGAVERRLGCFELANGGTLLLDEIGDMPMATQAKLLRVLEDSRVRRLGGRDEMQVDVRVIASTNKNLEEAIKKGAFREDLFYRLHVFPITLPPLRERCEDIPALCAALLADLNRKHGCRVTDVSQEALGRFAAYPWPGNVRELRNVLERALILAGEGSISKLHLGPPLAETPAIPPETSEADSNVVLSVGTTVEQAEKALIFRTLAYTKNNKTRAAEILGVSVKTLFNKLRDYGAREVEP